MFFVKKGEVVNLSKSLSVFGAALLLNVSSVQAGVIVNGSSMLDANDGTLTQLENWLGQGELTLTNIFTKNQTDGISGNDTARDWHNAVDGQGATFTLWEVTTSNGRGGYDNFIYGGYNDESWSSYGGWDYDHTNDERNNFIFNLTTGVKLDQCLTTDVDCGGNWNPNDGRYATYNNAHYGATFGGGFDLYVSYDLNHGHNYQYSYGINDVNNYEHEQAYNSLLDLNHSGYYSWLSVGAYETFIIDSYTPSVNVSEPTSFALLGLGLLGLVGTRRKLPLSSS